MSQQYHTDPFTLEIIKDALHSIGEEMFTSLARTSMSTIIYETLDYASGLTDREGNLLTQGNGITGFIGMLTFMVKETLAKFPGEQLKPGDLIIINDPYQGGGSHLSDVGLVLPIFYQNNLVGFSANKAHWSEVGGKDVGSFTNDSVDIYQEGLQFSCVKLFNEGEINEALVDIIRSNVRFPDQSLGDMWAQISALRLGEQRLLELYERYTPEVMEESVRYLLNHGETISRQELAKLPDGIYEAEEYIDTDGLGNGPFLVKVKITIDGEEITFDFTGSAGQAPGPINLTYSGLVAGVRAIFLSIATPDQEVNDGIFRPMHIIAKPKSIMSAERPVPVSNYFITMLEVINVIQKALADILPHRLGAGHYSAVCSLVLGGLHPETDQAFLLVEPTNGGWGASPNADGQSGQFCYGNGETYNVPVEVAETRYGVLVDEYSLRIDNDGAGAGEYIGGFGITRIYRALNDGQTASVTFGHHESKPWGVDGGHEGSSNDVYFEKKDGSIDGPYGMYPRYILNTDDRVILKTGTGGGYGFPTDRPVDQVIKDVRNGYYNADIAREIFGVNVETGQRI
ncbi:5-oxoprolinase [Suicoccus acidiformans]|uniref:5-oxoprolinase n=1 Tax=Suicoccus acidiformans TaxID=2036206 RepID=A0A347WKS6_9LACT|nr:hydantoinase B/oxoprolinase family protein [Suicoccus acidiformans]AXY25683.1 5-oxoprolinase [Suicoccus acidiformans]